MLEYRNSDSFKKGAERWNGSGWWGPGAMPCVARREVVVDAVYATVHATEDYLQWASSHCARTSATAQPKPAQHLVHTLCSTLRFVEFSRKLSASFYDCGLGSGVLIDGSL